ncbi:MAG TPA: serine/threonine-protein kinase [Solirubrobacterales bacterium]
MPGPQEQLGEEVATTVVATGSLLKERYRLERLLGRGGMASVWLATDRVLERPVAVKIIADTIASDPEFRARFRREARVAAGLSHPNLIGVYDYADGAERPYLVMEYVAGDNLAQRLSADGEVDSELLARELLGALAHIHAAGIVHRDVKPQNVLIAPEGSAKLIDFGIALPADATALTQTGNLLGTARYIAPEVMRGERAAERSDLYSCGVVLRDCLGGDASANLRALVRQLCAEDPLERPRSAAAALARLKRRAVLPDRPTEEYAPTQVLPRMEATAPGSEAAASNEEIEAAPALPRSRHRRAEDPGPANRGQRRHGWRKAAAILAVCATLAGAFLLLGDDSGEKAARPHPNLSAGGGKGQEAGRAGPSEATDAPSEAGAAASEESAPSSAAASVPEPAGSDEELGSTLNQEGFELIQAGDYEGAVPLLEEAVRAFPPETEDLDYAYALFNLGNALRLSGRPEEAIPILERRLAIPNQTEAVREELAAARSEAGP